VIRVKTCGITFHEDAMLCVEAGADALGLVIEYPEPVPWTLTRAQARSLADAFRTRAECVAVVGGDAATIIDIVEAVRPHAVQLHRDESPEVVAAVKDAVGDVVAVVKAVRIPVGDTQSAAHWLSVAREFVAAGADRILLDSRTATRPAGTGVTVDWSIAAGIVAGLDVPVVLAGGLTPGNVGEATRQVRPWAVDVISAIEDERHRKVRARVEAFVAAAKHLDED
jgi:phosphoribosylanthranilate isomerase